MHRQRRRRAFTLVEILVVLTIILLVATIAIPVTFNALSGRQVTDAARIFQGALAGVRNAAIGANKPRGIRLLPDPTLTIPPPGSPGAGSVQLVYNRMLAIEPGTGASDGRVSVGPMPIASATFPPAYPPGGVYPFPSTITGNPEVLMLEESPYQGGFITPNGAPNAPTEFFWNVRLGDTVKIGTGTAGRAYTVVGPCTVNPSGSGANNGNNELYVNVGPPGTPSPLARTYYKPNGSVLAKRAPEFLFLVNGDDDDGDGWVDEGWDGVNQNPPPPAAAPPIGTGQAPQPTDDDIADNLIEWETERWVGAFAPALLDPAQTATDSPSFAWSVANRKGATDVGYTFNRRPVPSAGAREILLPTGVVIDATTWNSTAERSRLPIEANTLHCDIMLTTQGEYVAAPVYSTPVSASIIPFLHFWVTDRQGVHPDGVLWGNDPATGLGKPNPAGAGLYRLPMTADALGVNAAGALVSGGFYPPPPPPGSPPLPVLKGDRRIITLFSRTGLVMTNTTEAIAPTPGVPIPGEGFHVGDVSYPFYRTRLGQRGNE